LRSLRWSGARGELVGAGKLADDLTRLRDGLHRALCERAEEKALPRDWADAFFRVERDGARREEAPAPTPTPR